MVGSSAVAIAQSFLTPGAVPQGEDWLNQGQNQAE